MLYLIGLGIFISALLLIEGVYYTYKELTDREAKSIRRRLRRTSSSGRGYADVKILRETKMSEIPWLNRFLIGITRLRYFDRLLRQANIKYPLGVFVLLSLVLFFIGFLGGQFMARGLFLSFLAGVSMGMLPFYYVRRKKQKRMLRFQVQLPEVLDLIARSLKAGHAFAGGLRIVADEMNDPAGTEFGTTLDEVNFGVDVREALKNLSLRMDCEDLKYFVVAVIIQRETGGNLTEILENISYLIRERFKLQGKINGLTAEGRLSAIILIVLPFFLAFAIYFLNPSYMAPLSADSMGRILVASALFMMVSGILVIRKIIRIKV